MNKIKKTTSKISLSTNDSYQSITESTIKCCICMEEVNNENSYMPTCKHSWCKDCNENLNKNNINSCPICKIEFKSILLKGRWKLVKNNIGWEWKYEKGQNDSKKKLKYKKIQQFFSNIALLVSYNNSISI